MKLRQMLLLATALLIFHQISAQDLIFKKSGEIVKAKILGATDESLTYKLYNPVDSLTHVINTHTVDSVIYQNGLKTSFKKINIAGSQPRKELNAYNTHHLIGFDVAGYVFYRNLTLSYEYLPGNANWGFKVAFAKNVEPQIYYLYDFSFSRTPDWSTRVGINYYFFPIRTFRLGTGLYYIFGKTPASDYVYNQSDNRNMSGVVFSFFGFYNLNEHLALNPGFDLPLSTNPSSYNFNIAIRCEILFNF